MVKHSSIPTVEAIVDADGRVHLTEEVHLSGARRALVTILDDQWVPVSETADLSEDALAQDWNRPEEDEAWAQYKPGR